MEHNANQITLRGNLSAPPTFSHENHGKQFYRFFLAVSYTHLTLPTNSRV